MIVTIDGPAASGKGTLAAMLQEHYNFFHLDTGLVYRSFAFFCAQRGDAAMSQESLEKFGVEHVVEHPALRTNEIDRFSSLLASHPEVRQRLLEIQRSIIRTHAAKEGVVLDGRDAGTVVCPDADVKFYLVAHPEQRAYRRMKQRARQDLENVLSDLQERDQRDQSREHSPLLPAGDAIIIDTTHLTPEEIFLQVCKVIDSIRT